VLQAVFFDLDDTLVAWDMVADQSWKKVCWDFASVVGGLNADELYTVLDEVRAWYLSDKERHQQARLNLEVYRREVVTMALTRLGVDAANLADEIAKAYGIERENAACILPDAIDTLKFFKNSDTRLALISNGAGSAQRRKIDRFGLASFFDYILIEGEFGFGKPDSKVFTHALKKCGASAEDTWMVGDDLERDIGGAQNIGIHGIWVDWRGYGLPKSTFVRPDRIVKSISALIKSGFWEA